MTPSFRAPSLASISYDKEFKFTSTLYPNISTRLSTQKNSIEDLFKEKKRVEDLFGKKKRVEDLFKVKKCVEDLGRLEKEMRRSRGLGHRSKRNASKPSF